MERHRIFPADKYANLGCQKSLGSEKVCFLRAMWPHLGKHARITNDTRCGRPGNTLLIASAKGDENGGGLASVCEHVWQ